VIFDEAPKRKYIATEKGVKQTDEALLPSRIMELVEAEPSRSLDLSTLFVSQSSCAPLKFSRNKSQTSLMRKGQSIPSSIKTSFPRKLTLANWLWPKMYL